jgi:ATP-dependent exoDNAse (exonuclease V) alpha subunit
MQIVNDYDKEVYNGDIGYVGDVDPEVGEVTVTFDGPVVTYGFGELDVLVPAYATTIHKSQGSEYPAVIIPVLTQHYPMLQRNLLYTGVTRGKRLVVLVGQKKAVAIAVRNASSRRRWSKLESGSRRALALGEQPYGCDTSDVAQILKQGLGDKAKKVPCAGSPRTEARVTLAPHSRRPGGPS